MKILAIDPGTLQSAYIVWNGETWTEGMIVSNNALRPILRAGDYDACAIEMVACYGMAVGKEVFETCVWIGRFAEIAEYAAGIGRGLGPALPQFVYRRQIKSHFCNSMKAKDSNIRQAILDQFGGKAKAIGLKATPGPLYGIKSHLWSALAIALYIQDQTSKQPVPPPTECPESGVRAI